MEYNSDFDIRLATLGALGGDITKQYDSVYEIDLAILDAIQGGGGGGGLNYDQIKSLLSSSGVTEIVFNNSGDTSSVTLDYDLISQIGQGGESNYFIRNTYDELSGITDVKNGAIAYIKGYTTTEESLVVTTDWYPQCGEWDYDFNVKVDYGNDDYYYIKQRNGGNDLRLRNPGDGDGGTFEATGNANYEDIHNRLNLPTGIIFTNGATGTFQSFVDKIDSDNCRYECECIFYFAKYNGQYPTVTFEDESEGRNTIVSATTAVTDVQIYNKQKGWYQYNNAVTGTNKWLETKIYVNNLNQSELNAMMERYIVYKQQLSIIFSTMPIWSAYGHNVVFDAMFIYEDPYSENTWTIYFGSKFTTTPAAEPQLFGASIAKNNEHNYNWFIENGGNPRSYRLITGDDLSSIYDTIYRNVGFSIESLNKQFGRSTLYNIAMSGSVEMEVYKIVIDREEHPVSDWTNIGGFYDNRNGQEIWFNYKDGLVNFKNLIYEAEVSPDWQIIDYTKFTDNNQNKWNCVAFKFENEGSGVYNLQFAIPAISGDDRYSESRYEMRIVDWEDEWKRDWTKESNETFNVTPHIYTSLNWGREQNENKLIQLI